MKRREKGATCAKLQSENGPGTVLGTEVYGNDENHCPTEAQGRMCKGKGASIFEQLVCAIHILSHFKNYLGWNHMGEDMETG